MSEEAGHPKHFGFEQCTKCGVWRPREKLTFFFIKDSSPGAEYEGPFYRCPDADPCRK